MSEISAANAGTIKIGDFTVNRMGFGAMRLTGEGIWGEPADHEKAVEVLKEAVKLGVNFIDTADSYGPEVSENLIAEALRPYEGLVIATKGGKYRPGPGIWRNDCRPEHLQEALEGSLRRLGVDRADVYQLHAVDEKVPFQDSLQSLIDLKAAGKIKHIGLSNITAAELNRAVEMTEIVSVQNHYNIFARDEGDEVIRVCEKYGIAFIPYFPLGGGRWQAGADRLRAVADKYEATPSQIALAWLLARSTVMLPIPGTSSIDHLRENIAAASIRLDADDMASLSRL